MEIVVVANSPCPVVDNIASSVCLSKCLRVCSRLPVVDGR